MQVISTENRVRIRTLVNVYLCFVICRYLFDYLGWVGETFFRPVTVKLTVFVLTTLEELPVKPVQII